MRICLACLTHNKTPAKYLEKLYALYRNSDTKLLDAFAAAAKNEVYLDWVLLPTCHRFELYALTNNPDVFFRFFDSAVSKIAGKKAIEFVEHYLSEQAMEHLSLVAAGTESKIIGEMDIMRQVKAAYIDAIPHCNESRALSDMFKRSLQLALKWRNRSSLQKGYLSYADIPLEIISENFPNLNKNILIFGKGMMGLYFLRELKSRGAKKIYLCSRDLEKAKSIADVYGAEVVDLDDSHNIFAKIDIFIFCMAGGPFLDLHKLLPKIRSETIIFDLGVPPNTPGGINKIKGVTLYTMADFDDRIERDSKLKLQDREWVAHAILHEVSSLFPSIREKADSAMAATGKKPASEAEIDDTKIRAYVLENSIKFGGRPRADSVISKLFLEGLAKDKLRFIAPRVAASVKQISEMPMAEQEKEFSSLKEEVIQRKEQQPKKVLPELPNVSGGVVTRIAPEPSKYMHIGHALVFLIQFFYARKYGGECILRMEDTNPEKATQEYYDSMIEDLKWLGVQWDRLVTVSDDMPLFFNYAEKLITWKDAYVCSCSGEQIKSLRAEEKQCQCRNKDVPQNLHEWQDMLGGKYAAGKMTLRLKGDMGDQNATMRDPIIFRLFDIPHFRVGSKYPAWPMYDLENPTEDSICGVTHVIRTKEFELREELHKYILFLLSMRAPSIKEISRYNIEGAITQGREIRKLFEEKKINGWDDPRLVTIKALKRRGYVPEMFHELARTVGLSKSSGKIDFSVLEAINKRFIDPIANRYFFIENPKKVKIKDAPAMKAELDLHPDEPSKGKREFDTSGEFYVADELKKGKAYRFIHLFNFKDEKFVSKEHDASLNATLIHWLPAEEDNAPVEIVMDDGSIKKGLAEKGVKHLKEGEVIQFERFGFCRFDRKEADRYVFWLTHK